MLLNGDSHKKIVLVDDDPVNIQICKMVLTRTIPNIEFRIFQNGLAAIEWMEDDSKEIENGGEQILLLDLNMPVLNGWGFMERFTKFSNELRSKFSLFILSSSIDPLDIARAKEYSSIKQFYTKPLNYATIKNIFSLSDPAIQD